MSRESRDGDEKMARDLKLMEFARKVKKKQSEDAKSKVPVHPFLFNIEYRHHTITKLFLSIPIASVNDVNLCVSLPEDASEA